MNRKKIAVVAAIAPLALMIGAEMAMAQKAGGILKAYHRGTPPSGSIHEEATNSTLTPYMGVMNNLVMYDQGKATNSLDSIVPDLATSWSWNGDKTKLTFKLREGVKWHDGKPFTAKDVQCTFDMLQGKRKKFRLRKNPRKAWYKNLESVSTNGKHEVTFNLKRSQPALLTLLASGYTPIYSCHVPPKKMRTHPIGTGPFKFVALKQNESVKFTRNKDYWKKDRPYLDGIEWTIIKSRSTRVLAFIAGKFDLVFNADVTVPLQKDIAAQAPHAVCERVAGASINLIVNQAKPPFDNPKIRRAMVLTIDRKSFVDIISKGENTIGGAMTPGPQGVWGMSKDFLKTVAGYNPNVKANREKARALMREAGYGPDKRLKMEVSTRNIATYRDPAVILIDHMKEIYIDATLKTIETSNWHATVARKDYSVGLNATAVGVDDPDANFFENYSCGSQRNYTGYCNQDMEKLFVKQSMMTDQAARKKLVWDIDKRLQEDAARPIIYHNQSYTCWQPKVKGLVAHVNSLYNGWRMEDVWLKQ
ncbi:MAG: ABC transporter substrate-binding protein [Alphaproteobacteria bacterium]|nr:ABC transporter substrate-binding protein [Alphaproteobacteria bacterium]